MRAFCTMLLMAIPLTLPSAPGAEGRGQGEGVLGIPANADAEDKKPAPPLAAASIPREVFSLLQSRCVKCHGPEKEKAQLDLTTPDGIARGSRYGPVIKPSNPSDSPLWQLVSEGKMPPQAPLPDAERRLLRDWIANGAPGLPTLKAEATGPSAHWAFRPATRPRIPAVREASRLRTNIDPFIQAVLEKKQLSLGSEADRATLLRRVSFDLIGLPPTLAEIEAFLNDQAPDAYDRMIERYLASPHYGERWGKYWLDAAGYADSNGYFSADSDRPLAHRYRDYVIRSFNQDKPYDRFVREQLTGDEMAGYDPSGDVAPEMVDLLTATHFLRNAPDGTGESDGNPDEVRTDRYTVLEGNLQVTISCLLGITIQCARCHEHKFEPIRHEEYYRLQSIFLPVYNPDRWIKPNDRVVHVGPRAQIEEQQRRIEQINKQIKALQTSLDTIATPFREQLIDEHLQPLEPAKRSAVLKAIATPKEKRPAEQQALLKEHEQLLKVSDDELAKRFPDYAVVRERLRMAVASREKERPPPPDTIPVFVESAPNPPTHHVLLRGQHNAPGPEVQPGVPRSFCTSSNAYRLDPPGRTSTGRRTAFARWVTSPENPLFARVMVNRIWQHHFGTGLVSTPDNLGISGAKPSHPELLDYLATEFNRTGWSVKAMHRLILTSAVYRQASKLREDAYQVDPDNRLLWRFPLRRIDAEAVRDAMLFVSGELNVHMGGPYVPTNRVAAGTVEVDEKRPDARKRSVYLQQRRTQVATLLELFDAPSVVANCTHRNTSTVPMQSLALLNSEFALLRAHSFATRLQREAGADEEKRITLTFRLACARDPGPEELALGRHFLSTQKSLYLKEKESDQRAWTDFCQMILASNVFLYVD